MNNNKIILEELYRMKYLFGYKKGKVISEQSSIGGNMMLITENPKQDPIKVTITKQEFNLDYNGELYFAYGNPTPSKQDITNILNGINAEIQKNPELSQKLKNKSFFLRKIQITSGASNSTKKNGKDAATPYDVENDRVTKSKETPSGPDYEAQKNLAIKRGENVANQVKDGLIKLGVQLDNNYTVYPTGVVVNTNGLPDDLAVNQNLNRGQFCGIKFYFGYSQTNKLEEYPGPLFTTYSWTTGTYTCNGVNGAGQQMNISDVYCYKKRKCQAPNCNSSDYLAIIDLKWNANLKPPKQITSRVVPAIRYEFYWENRKIVAINVYNPSGDSSTLKELGITPGFIDQNGFKLLLSILNRPTYSPETKKTTATTSEYSKIISDSCGSGTYLKSSAPIR